MPKDENAIGERYRTKQEKQFIDEWLALYQAAAVEGLQTARVARRQNKNPMTEGQVKYWENAVSVIKWMRTQNQRSRKIKVYSHDTKSHGDTTTTPQYGGQDIREGSPTRLKGS